MKRDMDLCRTLLLRVEELELAPASTEYLQWDEPFFIVERHSVSQAIYNFSLLRDAGFVVAPSKVQGLDSFGIQGLSWAGHEFLDTVRNPEVWTATKAVAKKAGGLDLLVQIAKAETKRFLATHLGLPP
jgi:hypothetical protein